MILVNELSSSEHQLVYVMSFYTFHNMFLLQRNVPVLRCFVIISEDSSILNTSTLNKVVAKTLELFPNPTKLLVGAPS